jgi:hypothetical protein
MQVLPTLPSPTMTNLTGIGYCDITLEKPTIYYNPNPKKIKTDKLIKNHPSSPSHILFINKKLPNSKELIYSSSKYNSNLNI